MKRILNVLICISLVISSCDKDDDTLIPPRNFTASDGTYLGVVHLSVQAVDEVEKYIIERKDPAFSAWIELTWQPWAIYDDVGYLLPNTELIPGQKYEYRARAHSNGPGFSDYCEPDVGYSYNTLPAVITNTSSEQDPKYEHHDLVTVYWTDSLPQSILNYKERRFTLRYADESNIENWVPLTTISSNVLTDKNFSITFSLEKSRNFFYRIDIEYHYTLTEAMQSTFRWYITEGVSYKEL